MRYLLLCLRELGSLWRNFVLCAASLTTTHREGGLPTSIAQQGGLREIGAREEGSLGLRFSNLIDQAGSHRQKASTHEGRCPQVKRPLGWLWSKPSSMSRGRSISTLTLSSYDPYISFSQASEHVEGESWWHERGEGRTPQVCQPLY
jgi:hypothetical protein